jgi:SAM-dependent methyltransferase
MSWNDALMQFPGIRKVSTLRTKLSARWYDWRYRIRTCGDEDPRELNVLGENVSHAVAYIPTTFRTGRRMLRDLPISDVSGHTFIDMGSGKGRMLLLAAELPFRRIIGVEFASDLDAVARRNVKTYRNPKQVCFQIEPVHADATQFEFPREPSLIYFFYPFDQCVMEPVIQNLNRSLEEHPRDLIVLYRNPVLSEVVEAASNLRVWSRSNYFGSLYCVYRSVFPFSPAAPVPA